MRLALFTYSSNGIRAIEELFTHHLSPEQIFVMAGGDDTILNEYIVSHNLDLYEEHPVDVLVSFYWRERIPKEVLDKQPSINFHPSLLPKYRGCNSIPHALIRDDDIGYTWHYMTENFDDGRIVYQQKIRYGWQDTAHSIYYRMIRYGAESILLAMNLAVNGYKGVEQKGKPSYFGREFPEYEDWMDRRLYERASYFPTKNTGIQTVFDW